MHFLFIWKKLFIFICHLLEGIFIVTSKITIDYNNILVKAQLSYIATVSDSKTHSQRVACIKDFGRYYIVFALVILHYNR